MDFLSEQLIATDYRDRLNSDLQRADVCRFLVAYISEAGLNSLDRPALVAALRNELSFGISSLSCACGYSPLLQLQRDVGDSKPRLKYFMDPLVKNTDEPDGIALFHSKLVYLRLPHENKSVIYIGSHNWSGRALGPGRPRNVEASIRFELEYTPHHITGSDQSIASQVNRHLLSAYGKPACLPATADNELTFEQWYEFGCRNAPPSPLEPVTVILAVQKNADATIPDDWTNLVRQGIYLQALEEIEGKRVRTANDKLIVMVWASRSDLHAGIPPILLRCRFSSFNAGATSDERGTNQSLSPMAGFGAAIYDESQLQMMQHQSKGSRSTQQIWSGHDVEMYDFEFRQQPTDSAQIDGGVQPKYQFHLEVDQIIFPSGGNRSSNAELLWTPESFAVAKSKDDAKLERVEGYYVPPDVRVQILLYLTEDLLIDRNHAKIWPVSEYDRAKEGKRVSKHPLHDTFIGKDAEQRRDAFYDQAKRGALVAELDEQREISFQVLDERKQTSKPVERVQKVFTTKLAQLPQLVEKALCFREFWGVFSHYIGFKLIFVGRFRPSLSSRICW
ncbi:MAG: hypothetical protein WKF77_21750 [Planctomycetaceae bacterium]